MTLQDNPKTMTTNNQSPSTQSSSDAAVHLYEDFPGNLYLVDTCTRRAYKVLAWTNSFSTIAEVDSDVLAGPEYTHVASYSLERGVHDIKHAGGAARQFLAPMWPRG